MTVAPIGIISPRMRTEESSCGEEGTCVLDELFYESVTLSEKLSKYVAECAVLLDDSAFTKERDECKHVLDQELPKSFRNDTTQTHVQAAQTHVQAAQTHVPATQTHLQAAKTSTTAEEGEPRKDTGKEGDEEEEDVESCKVSSASSLSQSESELALSDELTEVSSTDSSLTSSEKHSDVALEIDEYGFKDCVITRRVNPPDPSPPQQPRKRMNSRQRTRAYIDAVDKKVSCKCCRSVMGQIVHEIRAEENKINISKLKPYQPQTSYIDNLQEAVEFQMHYEREWYAAVAIQRAWRGHYHHKMKEIRIAEQLRLKNEMRLKYGHIAGFVRKRNAMKLSVYHHDHR